MGLVELFLIAVGLSMDAFAVAICKGLGMKQLKKGQALVIALLFGGFQALMPLIGWLLGKQFEHIITPIADWVAFALLGFLGCKMLWDSFREKKELVCSNEEKLDMRELIMMAVATSIDALAVGVTFAFMRVNIAAAVGIIGATTFAFSLVGVAVGFRFGAHYKKAATIVGGLVLILMAIKILLTHFGIIPE